MGYIYFIRAALPYRRASFLCFSVALSGCTGMGLTGPSADVPGQPESAKTNVLEAGASALQTDAPTDQLNIYLVGFHPMKDEPSHQFEAHHFCQQVNEDFMQCALYDGNTADAHLNGVEYIISERIFEGLPEEEKKYWHPHNGEILSGQLVAPNLPETADHELMQSKMNSYGKTWHTWATSHSAEKDDSLPLGKPELAWSFNRTGEPQPGLVKDRDQRMGIDTEERRKSRQDLVPLANPQSGVGVLKGKFPRMTQPIPGVEAKSTNKKR
ncbi:OBAP family protein [Salinicola lusitanus]|uniref:OBAP family protein n=1 Tax=Salinicola lusitanus TaxID=1949085 RepID=A0ABZ3CPD2_9GAMM